MGCILMLTVMKEEVVHCFQTDKVKPLKYRLTIKPNRHAIFGTNTVSDINEYRSYDINKSYK